MNGATLTVTVRQAGYQPVTVPNVFGGVAGCVATPTAASTLTVTLVPLGDRRRCRGGGTRHGQADEHRQRERRRIRPVRRRARPRRLSGGCRSVTVAAVERLDERELHPRQRGDNASSVLTGRRAGLNRRPLAQQIADTRDQTRTRCSASADSGPGPPAARRISSALKPSFARRRAGRRAARGRVRRSSETSRSSTRSACWLVSTTTVTPSVARESSRAGPARRPGGRHVDERLSLGLPRHLWRALGAPESDGAGRAAE